MKTDVCNGYTHHIFSPFLQLDTILVNSCLVPSTKKNFLKWDLLWLKEPNSFLLDMTSIKEETTMKLLTCIFWKSVKLVHLHKKYKSSPSL